MNLQRGQASLGEWGVGTEIDSSLPPWKSPEVLRRLCYEEKLGPKAIAERIGCSPNTVVYWTDKFGIERPTLSVDASLNPASYSITNRGYAEWQAMTADGVRSIFVHRLLAISEHGSEAIKNKVVHHKNEIPWDNRPSNLEVMTQSEHATYHMRTDEGDSPWQNEETLKELYINQKMILSEIADKLGCTAPTVLRWMEKYDIDRRNSN